jgi:hypothetical protein
VSSLLWPACRRAGQNPSEFTLLCASSTAPAHDVPNTALAGFRPDRLLMYRASFAGDRSGGAENSRCTRWDDNAKLHHQGY